MTAVDETPRAGRPSKLTDERADTILQAVEQGSYLKVAAAAAGVGEATLHRWLADGVTAQRLLDAHDPDRLYCPDCDLDRTEEVETLRALERTSNDTTGYPVLGPCHSCRTPRPPAPYALPPEQDRYREFRESVTRAQAQAETSAVAAWRAAFSGVEPDWRAARDYLARVAPERWAGVTRVQMTTEETERRLDDAVNEALLSLGLDPDRDDDDLPRETEEP